MHSWAVLCNSYTSKHHAAMSLCMPGLGSASWCAQCTTSSVNMQHEQSVVLYPTLMSRRAAALLSCSLMMTITSVRGCPTTSVLESSTDGALSATASSVSASRAVSEPGARACHVKQLCKCLRHFHMHHLCRHQMRRSLPPLACACMLKCEQLGAGYINLSQKL